jgi:hypothetical protein
VAIADRVLIEIMTQANMSGVAKAEKGMLGLGASFASVTIIAGGLFALSKNLIDIAEEHSKAEGNLAAAVKARGLNTRAVQSSLASFMQTNRDFIGNQSEVIDSYAKLVREGVKSKDLSRLMTIALHIQAAEGGSLADSVFKVQQAEVGRNRGLTTAVGLTLEAIKTSDTFAERQHKIERNLLRVARAYKGATPTELQVATNHLATAWEKLAEKHGPALVESLTTVDNYLADHLIPDLEKVASDMGSIGDATDALVAHPSWQNLYTVLFGPPNDSTFGKGGALERLMQFLNPNNAGNLGAGGGLGQISTPPYKTGTQGGGHGSLKGHQPTAAEIAETARQIRLRDRSLR